MQLIGSASRTTAGRGRRWLSRQWLRLAVPKTHRRNDVCLISHRFRCIYIAIAKNASSTIKEELHRIDPAVETRRCWDVKTAHWERYQTFTFLRDPVTRTLSAYQEVSYRLAGRATEFPRLTFLAMPEGIDRFAAFLHCVENEPWDEHVDSQSNLIGDHRIDSWGAVETMEQDLEKLYRRIGAEPRTNLLVRWSRAERMEKEGYGKHWLNLADIPPKLIAHILRIYKSDVQLTTLHGKRPGPE